jgi:tetratricopeptide (TPR) repeat protein
MPGRSFSADENKAIHVHVIGWGLWAGFLQRQLCHAVQRNFNFLQWKWGVPDEAKTFAERTDGYLGGLRLYPFVRRFDSTDVAAYHQSVDDGFKVTVATPQLVAPECWNHLCYNLSTTESYRPNPNPHINEWHKHNPPPGTAYNIYPRLNHPSLVGRSDSEAWLDRLHDRAPYDRDLNYYIMENKFKNTPTHAQATEFFGAAASYSIQAMTWLAWSVKDQPGSYEALMSEAAAVNPAEYFTLAEYFADRKEDDKAAKYYERGNAADPDAVTVANNACWLVKYYLKKGRTEDARRVADFADEVYSFSGLQAKAEFLEATKDYAGAFQWYANIEERYEDSGPVVGFCLRYKNITGDSRFDGELQKRLIKTFPKGREKVGLADFSGPPADGVLLKENSDLLKAAGLKPGDVIVAAYGIRVHNVAQYDYERDNSTDPELDLIAWQGNGYNEIKASPPDHRFGVDIGDYQKN